MSYGARPSKLRHRSTSTNSARSGSTSGSSRLERGGEPIPLPPKAFDLLVLLARNTHRVMPKTELMETLWPNTFVEEANLTQHVYTLRKALGDRPDGSPYIETVAAPRLSAGRGRARSSPSTAPARPRAAAAAAAAGAAASCRGRAQAGDRAALRPRQAATSPNGLAPSKCTS